MADYMFNNVSWPGENVGKLVLRGLCRCMAPAWGQNLIAKVLLNMWEFPLSSSATGEGDTGPFEMGWGQAGPINQAPAA